MSISAPRVGSVLPTVVDAGNPHRHDAAGGVGQRTAGGGRVVGVEQVAGRRLRVAAAQHQREHFDAGLDVVRAPARARSRSTRRCRSAGCCRDLRDRCDRSRSGRTAGRRARRGRSSGTANPAGACWCCRSADDSSCCEYCAVAKKRFASTPFQLVDEQVAGRVGVIAAGRIDRDRQRRRELRSGGDRDTAPAPSGWSSASR